MRFGTAASITLAVGSHLVAGFSLNWLLPFGLANNPTSGDLYSGLGHGSSLENSVSSYLKTMQFTPKVMIISMFEPESNVWYESMPSTEFGDIMAHNITTPGLSPLYPFVHCVEDGSVCQVTVGEAEINAAATVMALVLSPKFDLRRTYFMVAGIAGISPLVGTQGSVSFSRFAVQVALQYEFDAREMPENFSTGYFGYGTRGPGQYPAIAYGTEVFEVNENLRDRVAALAEKATLADTESHRAYGRKYLALGEDYAAAAAPPGIIKVDSTTSDVYFSGAMLSDTFRNITETWTNGTGVYGVSAQEENATLEVLLRLAIDNMVDFGRIIIMRTGSNFDRPPPDKSVYEHLVILDQNGLDIATKNIFLAGIEVIRGIVKDWDSEFQHGIQADNYLGDIFGSLGGSPDFGMGSLTNGAGAQSTKEREAMAQKRAAVRLTRRGQVGK